MELRRKDVPVVWAALRRILNHRTTQPRHLNAVADRDRRTRSGPPARRPDRPPYGNQRPGYVVHPPGRINQGPFVGVYRSRHVPAASSGNIRLRPWHVRNRRFGVRWRGLDPTEIHGFLDQVAHDLTAVYAELATAREETQRIKDALRQWQSEQAPTACDLAGVRR